MATMISEVYDALRDAQGVSEEKARKAAEAVANFENRFVTIERKIDGLDQKIDLKIEEVRGTLRVHQWMLGTILAGIIALLVRVFTHS